MNLQRFEEKYWPIHDQVKDLPKGDEVVLSPDEGEMLELGEPLGTRYRITIDPLKTALNTFTSYDEIIPPGKTGPLFRLRSNEVTLYVREGQGSIEINGKSHELTQHTTVYIGRNNSFRTTNTGDSDLVLVAISLPSGVEKLLRRLADGTAEPISEDGEPEFDWWYGDEEILGSRIVPGPTFVLSEGEGESYWTPGEDMQGYIRHMVTPYVTQNPMYAVALQHMEPESVLSAHFHHDLDEFLYVVEGSGRAALDGRMVDIAPGSVVLHGRNRAHSVYNCGGGPWKVLAMITPPHLLEFLRVFGRPRVHGEEMPETFNDWTPEEMAVMSKRVGLPGHFIDA